MAKGGRWVVLFGFLALVSCGTVPEGAGGAGAATAAPAPAVATATPEELRLYHMIMDYRASRGLPEIPLSPSLTKVAQIHVRDLDAHFRRDGACNAHSWSDNGDWTPCCYTPDHAEAECMWFKPQELTAYPGHGFEIAYYYSAGADAAGALRSWQGRPPLGGGRCGYLRGLRLRLVRGGAVAPGDLIYSVGRIINILSSLAPGLPRPSRLLVAM